MVRLKEAQKSAIWRGLGMKSRLRGRRGESGGGGGGGEQDEKTGDGEKREEVALNAKKEKGWG